MTSRADNQQAWLWWLAALLPVSLAFALCYYWEPVRGDGWGHAVWHRDREHMTGYWGFVKYHYWHGNPRIGQLYTLVAHISPTVNTLLSTTVMLLTWWATTALALGRLPRWRARHDALCTAVVVALSLWGVWSVGMVYFYRPVTGNYVYSFATILLLLVPYRVWQPSNSAHAGTALRMLWQTGGALGMVALGGLAGFGNEHVGLGVIGLMVLAIWHSVTRWRRLPGWMVGGLLGYTVGFIALLQAPGQKVRYEGLAQKASALDRVLDRSVIDSVVIVGRPLVLVGLASVGFAIIAWWAWRTAAATAPTSTTVSDAPLHRAAALALAALVIMGTTLASPKQGARMNYAATMLFIAAAVSLLAPHFRAPRPRRVAAALAALMIGICAFKLTVTFHTVGAEFNDRLARMRAGAGQTLVVPRYSVAKSRYFAGDDFTNAEFAVRRGTEWYITHLSVTAATPNRSKAQ